MIIHLTRQKCLLNIVNKNNLSVMINKNIFFHFKKKLEVKKTPNQWQNKANLMLQIL